MIPLHCLSRRNGLKTCEVSHSRNFWGQRAIRGWCFALISLAIATEAITIPGNVTDYDSVYFSSVHTALPGAGPMCVLNQTSGFIDIDPSFHKRYFYWLFPSMNNPDADPLILWMTGGPGCSAGFTIFFENGPCLIHSDGTAAPNESSLNTNANVIYIDQPAGTGFSTADPEGMDTTEVGIGRDMIAFLRGFFEIHPHLLLNDFFIMGSSYAGHYIPVTAWYLLNENRFHAKPYINLRGVAIGNGLTGPSTQAGAYPEMLYNFTAYRFGTPLISQETYEEMMDALPTCLGLVTLCNTEEEGDAACIKGMNFCSEKLLQPSFETGRNPYDLRLGCIPTGTFCYDIHHITDFLNNPELQSILGVSESWQACNNDVIGMLQTDYLKNYSSLLSTLLDSGVRVLLYAGEYDYVNNWMGVKRLARSLSWSGREEFANARDEDLLLAKTKPVVGKIRSAKGLSFVQVYDAGHFVGHDQPQVILSIVKSFMKEKNNEHAA